MVFNFFVCFFFCFAWILFGNNFLWQSFFMALFKSKLMVQLNLNTQQQKNENTFSIHTEPHTCTHAHFYGIHFSSDWKKKTKTKKNWKFFLKINHCTPRFSYFVFKKNKRKSAYDKRKYKKGTLSLKYAIQIITDDEPLSSASSTKYFFIIYPSR